MATTTKLPNGITIVTDERAGAGKVSMQVHIRRGVLAETAELCGATYLMTESTLTGTKTRSRDEIADTVEGMGGELDVSVELTRVVYTATALKRAVVKTFDVMADVILNPAFAADEILKEKEIIKQSLKQQQESVTSRAALAFYEGVFAGQVAGQNIAGTPELVDSFTPAQLQALHADMLADPSKIVISFAGDITAAEAEKMAHDYFAGLAARPVAPVSKAVFTGGDKREATEHKQMNIYFGFPTVDRFNEDRYAYMLFNEILSGGMSAPLFQEIREKRGLVYSVHSQNTFYDDAGVFSIVAGTGKGNVGELIRTSFELLADFARNPRSDDEIETAVRRMIRAREGALERISTAAGRNASQLVDYGRLIPAAEFEAQLRRITADDIRRVAIDMLKSGTYALGGVGPQETMPSEADIKAMMRAAIDGAVVPEKKKAATLSVAANVANDDIKPQPPRVTVLKNGITVITTTRPGTVACGAWLKVGADNEPEAVNGASHMNEHMMFKGTPSFVPGEIDSIVENELSAGLNAYTSHDKTCYYFYNLAPDALPKIVQICGEMVFHANISDEEFDGKVLPDENGNPVKQKGERDVVLEEILRANDKVGTLQWNALNETCYPGQPHGRTVLGPYETIATLTAQQLRDYRDQFYVSNNAIFSAVGPVDHDAFVREVEKQWGHLQPRPFAGLTAPQFVGGQAIVETDKAVQCSIAIAAPGVGTNAAAYQAYRALAAVLGEGASSRFEKDIVLNKQLTNGVGAYLVDYSQYGTFAIVSKADADKVRPLTEAVYANINRLVRDLSQDELEKAKVMLEMQAIEEFETNNSTADMQACYLQAMGRPVTVADILADIRKLTLDDVKQAAKDILSANPASTFVLPSGTDRSLIPDHAEIIRYRDGGQKPATAAKPAVA